MDSLTGDFAHIQTVNVIGPAHPSTDVLPRQWDVFDEMCAVYDPTSAVLRPISFLHPGTTSCQTLVTSALL